MKLRSGIYMLYMLLRYQNDAETWYNKRKW
jgi:hypothetical protein